MNTITGKPVCGGIAFGKLELIKNETSCVQRIRVNDTKKETERFEAALLTAKKELDDLYKKALLEVGEKMQ